MVVFKDRGRNQDWDKDNGWGTPNTSIFCPVAFSLGHVLQPPPLPPPPVHRYHRYGHSTQCPKNALVTHASMLQAVAEPFYVEKLFSPFECNPRPQPDVRQGSGGGPIESGWVLHSPTGCLFYDLLVGRRIQSSGAVRRPLPCHDPQRPHMQLFPWL